MQRRLRGRRPVVSPSDGSQNKILRSRRFPSTSAIKKEKDDVPAFTEAVPPEGIRSAAPTRRRAKGRVACLARGPEAVPLVSEALKLHARFRRHDNTDSDSCPEFPPQAYEKIESAPEWSGLPGPRPLVPGRWVSGRFDGPATHAIIQRPLAVLAAGPSRRGPMAGRGGRAFPDNRPEIPSQTTEKVESGPEKSRPPAAPSASAMPSRDWRIRRPKVSQAL